MLTRWCHGLAVSDPSATVAALCTRLGRADLAERVAATDGRAARAFAIALVVGEFKQGKSSLVNGLLEREVCPVDDDLATAVLTVCHPADELSAVVHRRIDGTLQSAPIEPHLVRSVVTESGNPGNEQSVERVDLGVPSPLLSTGLVVVDSPGVGGLGAGQAAATLAFLRHVDVVLFTSDALAELSEPELAFLADAHERCPTVVVCVTKTDLTRHWRRVIELDQGHLRSRGLELPVLPLSSTLRGAALEQSDRDLDLESGFPVLVERLTEAVAVSRGRAAERAAAERAEVLRQLDAVLAAEEAVLADDRAAAERVRAAEEAKARLDHLRATGSRWSQVLNDRLADLGSALAFELRSEQRDLARRVDERLEGLSSRDAFEGLVRDVQTETASLVAQILERQEAGIAAAVADVAALLAADLGDMVPALVGGADLTELVDQLVSMPTRPVGIARRAASGVGEAIGALRGVQGGLILLSTMVTLLPGMAVFAVASPVALGVAASFGGKAVLDQRKRRVAEGRQRVRVGVRTMLDEVVFRVSNDLAVNQRRAQQELRDGISTRLAELQRTATAVALQAQAALDDPAPATRLADVRRLRAEIAMLGAP